ncbi:hypothetical protein IEN91_04725 [Bacillus velezensis]|uniref:hypothetical protein n=1 Tax=Bacillus velezensis TaxID=492670 RepID=UPI0018C63023|nr:hypothetical protein [Bacillus velezensis]QPK89748.1 hypothetical protein IEN91_04725 [Bacillus velezensis]
MRKHFENIEYLYGDANVRLPNSLFKDLSEAIKSKNNKTNVQQVAFAYTYLVTVAFLYKYTHFVDTQNETYIQNADIKELLGYSRTTKSIDKIIKKNGVLDELGLTSTTRDYPVSFETCSGEKVNGISLREFVAISDIDNNDGNYSIIKSIVKNKNYEVKEPLFLTTGYKDREYGTIYNIERTHRIDIREYIALVFDEGMTNIDFLMYAYFKSKCKGYKDNMRSMAVYKIIMEIGVDRSTFYNHLRVLKEKKYIHVNHMEWKWRAKGGDYEDMESNQYFWRGIQM